MRVPKDLYSCEKLRADVIALIDGELPSEQASDAQTHLAACLGCASFYKAAAALLETAKDAYPPLPQIDLTDRIIDKIVENDPLIAEIRAMRAEMEVLRSEMTELRQQLASVRGLIARTPPRPVARPLFPYAAPTDRLRQDA